jgi:hypothetical protein
MELDVTPELVRAIADLAGVAIPGEDMDSLITVMTDQVAMAARLRPLDYSDVPPITALDPRWR